MPAFLLSATFWKFLGIGLVAIALAAGIATAVGHYNHLKSQAALVPGLQGQVKSLTAQTARDEARAGKAAIDLVAAYAARDQAVHDLGVWRDSKTNLLSTIQEMNRHAAASLNPVCLPSAAERQLWNATLAKLTAADAEPGQGRAPGGMPADPARVH
jgi:hypothetical protein